MCPAHMLASLSALPISFQIVNSLAQHWWAVNSLPNLAPVGWAQQAQALVLSASPSEV